MYFSEAQFSIHSSMREMLLYLKYSFIFFFLDFIYLFIERGEGKKEGREGNIHVLGETSISCLSHAPNLAYNLGPGLQPRHMPWWGIEPVTFWFSGQHSIHWVTPVSVQTFFTLRLYLTLFFQFTYLKKKLLKTLHFSFYPKIRNNFYVFVKKIFMIK